MWRKRTLIIVAIILVIATSITFPSFAANITDSEQAKKEIVEIMNSLKGEKVEIVFSRPEEVNEEYVKETNYVVETEYVFPLGNITKIPEETEVPEETVEEVTNVENSLTVQTVEEDDPLAIKLIEIGEDGTRIYNFKNGTYTIPYNPIGREPAVSKSGYIEQITEVPHYLQQSYPYTSYGSYGTISSHGCGITSCAMVYSYLLDRVIMPDELAEKYGRYNTPVGSDYALFTKSAEELGLKAQLTYSWDDVEAALKNGCVVIANVRKDTIFTKGGHYIVYYGITDDGKILINDPNIYNYGEWSGKALTEGFKNGFDQKYCKYSFPCWIYGPKNIEMIEGVETVNNKT